MHLLLRSMARGWQALPAAGMQALPEQLAAALPAGTMRLGVRAASVDPRGVTLGDGTRLAARAVIVAVEPRAAAELLPGVAIPRMHGVTTIYHSCESSPLGEPTIVLDLDRPDLCANTLVVSEAVPSYAPAGRALVQTSIVGNAPPLVELDVRERLAVVYGTDTREWDHLATYRIREALPEFLPGSPLVRSPRLAAGLYVCGDHRATPSQQGALVSGRRAAAAVLADLGVGSA
jgi:phytoene dehydrogenase-like protein